MLAPVAAFNILLLPVLIYAHFQGECTLVQTYLGPSLKPLCMYIEDIWINILALNVLGAFLAIFMASGGGGGGHSKGKPSGGGSKSSGGSSHSSGGGH